MSELSTAGLTANSVLKGIYLNCGYYGSLARNITIKIKHYTTTNGVLGGSDFEEDDGSQVFSASVSVTQTGWVEFNFLLILHGMEQMIFLFSFVKMMRMVHIIRMVQIGMPFTIQEKIERITELRMVERLVPHMAEHGVGCQLSNLITCL